MFKFFRPSHPLCKEIFMGYSFFIKRCRTQHLFAWPHYSRKKRAFREKSAVNQTAVTLSVLALPRPSPPPAFAIHPAIATRGFRSTSRPTPPPASFPVQSNHFPSAMADGWPADVSMPPPAPVKNDNVPSRRMSQDNPAGAVPL